MRSSEVPASPHQEKVKVPVVYRRRYRYLQPAPIQCKSPAGISAANDPLFSFSPTGPRAGGWRPSAACVRRYRITPDSGTGFFFSQQTWIELAAPTAMRSRRLGRAFGACLAVSRTLAPVAATGGMLAGRPFIIASGAWCWRLYCAADTRTEGVCSAQNITLNPQELIQLRYEQQTV